MSQSTQPIVITRYASRKLYNPDAKEYVTLDDIADYIADGNDVRIIDKKTNEDLTSQYLIQIIAERESRGKSPLSVSVLTDLVRMYQDQTSALTPDFLSQSVEAYQQQQAKILDEIGKAGEAIPSPAKALTAMQDWQRQQTDIIGKMFGSMMGETAQTRAAPEPEAETEAEAVKKDTADDRIDQLEERLVALQTQLEKQNQEKK